MLGVMVNLEELLLMEVVDTVDMEDEEELVERLHYLLLVHQMCQQQDLLAVKTALQRAHKTQIVARLMVEELAFFGIRNVRDVATCLDS